jgi:hypothetical protein
VREEVKHCATERQVEYWWPDTKAGNGVTASHGYRGRKIVAAGGNLTWGARIVDSVAEWQAHRGRREETLHEKAET